MCGNCGVVSGNVPNKDRIASWVRALETGRYEQTRSRLYRGPLGDPERANVEKTPKYCCLGVACEVALADGVVLPDDWRQQRVLPDVVRDYFGLDRANPNFVGKSASTWNDMFDTNFFGIAALIRAEYLKVDDAAE